MKSIKIFTLLILIFSIQSYSQSYCDKNDFNLLKLPDGILISSEIDLDINSGPDIPVIEKYSTTGELIWHTESDNLSGYENLSNIRLFYFSDQFIYALLTIRDTHHNSGINQQVWKLKPSDGTILWKTDVFESDGTLSYSSDNFHNILEYDSNVLFLNVLIRDTNGSSSDGVEVYSIDKNNGQASSVYKKNSYTTSGFLLEKDSQGNLICSEGNLLYKINKTDFNSIIWKKELFSSSGELIVLDTLFVDESDNIYGFNIIPNGKNLYKYNAFDGEEEWVVEQIRSSSYGALSQFKIFGGNIYLTTSGRYGQFDYTPQSPKILKINVDTGEVLWTTNELMTIHGNNSTDNPISNQYATSFDLDCNEDIYATGFYQSQDNGSAKSGAWGVMKIDGNNGGKINDLPITNSIEDVDVYSLGKKAFVFNNQPVFYGNLQDGDDTYTEVFTLTDSNLNSIKKINYFCNNSSLSISDNETIPNKLNIYPNPVNSFLNIDNSNSSIIIHKINLHSLSGKKIRTWDHNFNTISLNNISSGIYFLDIITNKNLISKKIIKE